MVVAKNLLLSASLIAYASAVAIPHRRAHTNVARILPEGSVPEVKAPTQAGVKKPILDLNKLKKVNHAQVAGLEVDGGRKGGQGGDRDGKQGGGRNGDDENRGKGRGGKHGGNDEELEQTTTDVGEITTTTELPTETTAPPPDETEAPGQDDEEEQENEDGAGDTQPPREDEAGDEGGAGEDDGAGDAQPVGGDATKGLLVTFVAAQNGAVDFADVLVGAVPAIEAEPLTLSWFGAEVANAENNFLVFDTFADDAGRAAHLAGDVAASVIAQAPNFQGGLSIDAFDILAIKGADPALANTVTLGLHASFEAQDDKVADVQQFCADSLALAEAEVGTINWLCGQWPGTAKFLILDSFVDQASLDAHLAGGIAQNLLGLANDTLVAAPVIDQINIVAASVKTEAVGDDVEDVPPPAGGGAVADVARASESLTDSANFGLFVPFTAIPDTAAAVQEFVTGATALAAAEPGTLQWFAGVSENTTDFLVFDTFATAADRDAHLAGKVASGLLGQIAALSSVDIVPFDVLAIKSTNDDAAVASATSGVSDSLQITFTAAEGRVADVVTFLQAGLQAVEAEAATLNWAAAQITDTDQFIIFTSFAGLQGLNAHIGGEFFTTLQQVADGAQAIIAELVVTRVEVFAATVKPEAGAGAGDDGENGAEDGEVDENEGGVETTTTDVPTITDTTTAPAETETESLTTTTDSPSLTTGRPAPQAFAANLPVHIFRWM